MPRVALPLLLLVLFLIGTTGPGTANEADGPLEGVQTAWPVDLNGLADLHATQGGTLMDAPADLRAARLQADRVVIEFQWRSGVHARHELDLARYNMDYGDDRIVIDQAEVTFDLYQGTPLLYAFSDADTMALTTSSSGSLSLLPRTDEFAIVVGASPNSIRAGDAPPFSFWHEIVGPFAKGRTDGTVHASGDFSLYVDQLRVHAEGPDEAWSNWTGYRESDPDRPVTEFEERITVLHIENGTFVGPGTSALTLFLPALEADLDGTLRSLGVTGRIDTGDRIHIFEDTSLRLEGQATVGFQAEPLPGADGAAARLHLRPSGAFELQGATRIEAAPGPRANGAGSLAWISLAGLAALTTAGGMAGGYIPAPTRRLRRRQHTLWLARGHKARDAGLWTRASNCYKRATRLQREDPMAWYEWAHSELEAGHSEIADRLAERALEIPGMDTADVLELRAAAAWQRGDEQAFETHLLALNEAAPAMAKGLVADLEIDPARLDERVAGRLDARRTKEGLDGYA